jgi:hypothetical protein
MREVIDLEITADTLHSQNLLLYHLREMIQE